VNLAKSGDIQNMLKYKIISTLFLLQAIVVIFGRIYFFWGDSFSNTLGI
jgi:hypothetical protein